MKPAPLEGAEWVWSGLSALSPRHLCRPSTPQVEVGWMKGELVLFASCPQWNSGALRCGEGPEAMATHSSCDITMVPDWELGARSIPPDLLGYPGWHHCNPEMRADGKRQTWVKMSFQPCSLFMLRFTTFPGMCASLLSEYPWEKLQNLAVIAFKLPFLKNQLNCCYSSKTICQAPYSAAVEGPGKALSSEL